MHITKMAKHKKKTTDDDKFDKGINKSTRWPF